MATPSLSNFVCKITMTATGSLFGLFVLVHMIGNLKVYHGRAAFDSYAAWLREVGDPLVPHQSVLWGLRIVLSVCLVLHVWCGLTLWLRGRQARGPYRRRALSWQGSGARLMMPTGVVLLVFILIHLLDLTTGTLGGISFRHPDSAGLHAYDNLMSSLSRPGYAIFYMVVMLVLSLHLAQGLWSVLHDIGGTARRLRTVWVVVAGAVVLAVTLVNSSIPVAVMLGWIS